MRFKRGVKVVAFDRAGNRSPQTDAIVSTAACVDSDAPTAPRRMHQEATTQTAVVLAWDASTDNVGVVSYGIYANGLPIDS